MSKIASKLSRQIMAALLSVAMILPNMTVYASEVSDQDSILPASEVVETVEPTEEPELEENAADEEQPVLTEDEIPEGEKEAINAGGGEIQEEVDNDSEETGTVIGADFSIDFFDTASGHTAGEAVSSTVSGLTITGFNWFNPGNNHGIVTSGSNDTMVFNLKQKADIIVSTCRYTGGSMTSSAGNVIPGTADFDGETGVTQYTVKGATGTTTLTFTGTVYLHKLELEYQDENAPEEYTITVSDDGNGTASADVQTAAEGATVTLTATPDKRYKFKEWRVLSGGVTVGADGKFTMGAEAVSVQAIFEPIIRRSWDFVNDENLKGGNGVAVASGATGTVAELSIDATADNSGWDSTLADASTGAEAKNGTKITVTVEGVCKVNVSAENDKYTVDGVAATAADGIFDCEGEEQKVLIEMTADNHIKAIEVTPIYYVAESSYNFNSLDFKIDGFTFNNISAPKNGHGFRADAENATIKLNLSKKANITVLGCRYVEGGNAKNMAASSGTLSETTVEEGNESDHAPAPKYTISEAAAGELTLTFNNGNYIHSIEVEYINENSGSTIKPGSVGDKKWDLFNATEAKEINGKVEEYDGLIVDASSGKLGIRAGNWALFNSGTIIKVPVDGDCDITVDNYDTNYKVNGEAATTKNQTFHYTGEAKYVDVIATADSYIGSIEIKHTAPTIKEGTYSFGGKTEEYVTTEIAGLSVSGTYAYGNSHGIQTKAAGAKVILNLADTATIEVTTCCFGSGASKTTTMASSSGNVTETSVEEGGAPAPVFTVKGASGKTELTFSNDTYIHSIGVFYTPDVEKPEFNGKPDVWDFGAEEIAGANNNLTVDIINGFYGEGVTPGSGGKSISSFTAKDSYGLDAVRFVSDKDNNRIRTTNTKITRYDEKSKTDKSGKTYTGYVYSNNSATSATRLEIYLFEGDTLKCMLGANDGAATYILTNPDDEEYDKFAYTKAYGVEEAVFHAAETGWYKLYCTDEKLVCARITREHAPVIAVSGSIDTTAAADLPNDYGILYTNDTTGLVTEVTREEGTYSVELYGGYTYTASLKDIDTYVVKNGRKLTLADEETKTNDLSIEKVSLNQITGTISGLPAGDIKKLKIDFEAPDGYVYNPRMTINDDGTYEMSVETGVTYTLTAKNVNDYTLETTTISASENRTDVEITFTKKATYAVTLNITGVDDPSKAVVTFTNIDEEGYAYTFPVSGEMQLRNGRYSVKVTGLDNYPVVQGLTKNVNVNGAAVTSTVPFNSISSWDFAKMMADGNAITTIDGNKYFLGLALSAANVAANKNMYLLVKPEGKVTVPSLKAGDKVTIKYCYEATFEVNNVTENDKKVDENSKKTEQIDSKAFTVLQDGDLVITGVTSATTGRKNETYLCGIEVLKASDVVDYTATLNVGTDKTYKTINAALADVRKMSRTGSQVVTIMIDPGDYEEMLVIDVPNLVLKNASATPSIALKNKGVEIDENAVRVTWYYGHGYTYYSMGPDSKYDAELLEVNKSNGYASFKNVGAGSTAGSYWNASVTVKANNFSAEGIIFENSFNQYVSARSVEDVIEAQPNSAKEGTAARATMKTVGDTKVQEKEYVERAAALAIYNNISKAYFKNCKFISRQDTLYGGVGTTAAFEDCAVYGGTDYIFGGMTAVFKKCDLVFNTNDQTDKGEKDDVGYITAPQQESGRGYLMYECRVTSTQPGVDTASVHTSKPGYLGRPWKADMGEAVFYKTTIEEADSYWHDDYGKSLIRPAGWLNTLSGESAKCGEYGTVESASDIDNSAKRVGWSGGVFTGGKMADGTAITIGAFLGDWNPFAAGEDSVQLPTPPEAPTANPQSGSQVKSGTKVSLSADEGVAIYYTTGKTEDIAAPYMGAEGTALYNAPIEINPDTLVIKAFTVKNYVTSEVETFVYTLKGGGNTPVNPDEDDSGLTVVLDPKYIPEDGYVYTGNAITPAVIVKNNNIPLTEGVDYTVKYSNNKNANNTKAPNKQAKITVTGKGSFTGKATTTFTIYPKSLAKDEADENPVVAGAITVVKNKKVAPILVYNGIKLVAKDFSIDGASKFDVPAEGAEAPKVKVVGKGNFKDSREITVNVVASSKDLKKIAVKVNTNSVDYDGTPKNADITVTSGSDTVTNSEGVEDKYTVVYNTNRTDAGTVKFTVIGLGAYTGSVTKTFKIKPKKASISVTVDLDEGQTTASYEYVNTGVTIPDADLAVKDGDKELTKGLDYKVAYSNNKKVSKGNSTAKCNVTFIGNYKGSAKQTVPFTITPGTISDETVDVVAADKVFKKPGLYKSVPVVISKADGSQLKASDYTVKYYLDGTFATEMKGKDKVTAAGTKVYVKVTGKGNYANASDTVYAKGEYTVCAIPEGAQDLSTAKIEFYVKGSDKKTTKIEYTGKPIEFNNAEEGETPQYELRVMIGKGKNAAKVPEDKYDITYANNINKGKATVVITPKEGSIGYVGGKTATFNIVAQKVPTNLLGNLFGGAAPDLSNLIESILTNE